MAEPNVHPPSHHTDDSPTNDSPQDVPEKNEGGLTLTVLHKGEKLSYTFPDDSTLSTLSSRIASDLQLPDANQKFLISPRPGLLKPPFTPGTPNGALPLTDISTRKTTLLGSTPSEIAALNSTISASQALATRRAARGRNGPVKAATPTPTRAGAALHSLHSDAAYTFGAIRPLPHLAQPERAQAFLERLAADPGITRSMARRRFRVGLLTEMDPAAHTTRESRTLGLNRNGGEAIELRLRTDAYDGFRDYRTIRRTLCHELAHNVHSEHDAAFWDLCHAIEREVERDDWRGRGNAVGAQEFYDAADDGEVADHGGWTGGEYVLGSGPAGVAGSSAAAAAAGGAGETAASRREVMARAAEERLKRQKEQSREDGSPAPGPGS